MSCAPPPANNSRQIRALEARVRYLEKELSGIKEITGACLSGPALVVPVYSAVYDPATLKFTLTFASTPGETYQIQQSTDAVTWEVSDPSSIVGTSCVDSPDPCDDVYTTWVSNETWALEELPVYFRVRVFPKACVFTPSKPC